MTDVFDDLRWWGVHGRVGPPLMLIYKMGMSKQRTGWEV